MALDKVDIKSMMLCHKSHPIKQMISLVKLPCVSYMPFTRSLFANIVHPYMTVSAAAQNELLLNTPLACEQPS